MSIANRLRTMIIWGKTYPTSPARFCYRNANGDGRSVNLNHGRLVPAEGISESLLGTGKTDKRDIKAWKAVHLGRCGKVRRTAMPMFRSKDGHCMPARFV